MHGRVRGDSAVVLLAESHQDSLEMYGNYLRAFGYAVDEAEDGRTALLKATLDSPSVVVTETRLPHLGGVQLCELLRREPATQSIPIVVVTADAYKADIDNAYRAGADVVLPKPCLPEELMAAVQRCLDKSKALRDGSDAVLARVKASIATSKRIAARSHQLRAEHHSFRNLRRTTAPPLAPVALPCPSCGQALAYEYSHIVMAPATDLQQWDYYACSAGCGTFQYPQHSPAIRKLT